MVIKVVLQELYYKSFFIKLYKRYDKGYILYDKGYIM